MNVSVNSNREPTGAKTVRRNKTQEWLPENFLQPVDEEEVATKVPAPFYCAPLVALKGEVGLIWFIFPCVSVEKDFLISCAGKYYLYLQHAWKLQSNMIVFPFVFT